jgi:hypothetical protein
MQQVFDCMNCLLRLIASSRRFMAKGRNVARPSGVDPVDGGLRECGALIRWVRIGCFTELDGDLLDR